MLRATFSRFGFVSSASGLEAAYVFIVHIIEVGLDWIGLGICRRRAGDRYILCTVHNGYFLARI